jgi:hypothetical protein
MHFGKATALFALALATAACGQGNSDNVMSPEANALEPADVNAALGPEVTNTSGANVTANDIATNDTNTAKVPNINEQPDEPGTPTNNSASQDR